MPAGSRPPRLSWSTSTLRGIESCLARARQSAADSGRVTPDDGKLISTAINAAFMLLDELELPHDVEAHLPQPIAEQHEETLHDKVYRYTYLCPDTHRSVLAVHSCVLLVCPTAPRLAAAVLSSFTIYLLYICPVSSGRHRQCTYLFYFLTHFQIMPGYPEVGAGSAITYLLTYTLTYLLYLFTFSLTLLFTYFHVCPITLRLVTAVLSFFHIFRSFNIISLPTGKVLRRRSQT